MIAYNDEGRVYKNGHAVKPGNLSRDEINGAGKKTIAGKIMQSHGGEHIKFDAIASHDITYVSIIQSLRASKPDIKEFPLPYVLSNCHNTLCAVGGTINSDDHAFGLSAAKKYGGIFVPPHMAVIHQYVREELAGCGKMILGSDSHTRYGAIGTMGIGEGGGELVKQLLGQTYGIPAPQVVGVYLTGEALPWVGPQDVALALIGAVFGKGLVKNKVLEFFGPGVSKLSMDFRNGVDVMTTETACLSSIWVTDERTEEFLALHGRADDYKKLTPDEGAYYDALIEIDLSTIKPMIALPYHPSNVYEIEGLDISRVERDFPLKDKFTDGKIVFEQGIITGCAGGLYENIRDAAAILEGSTVGSGPFTLSVYPASQPVYLACLHNGLAAKLTRSGAIMRTAFCGPCFGAGEVPPNGGLSTRHATRNFPNREGSKPPDQYAGVALMDARSIAATAANRGVLTAASEENFTASAKHAAYFFDSAAYAATVYEGFGNPDANVPLVTGPGIRDWPEMPALADNLILAVASFIDDPVTTTDELIPSGETSSYRSNPIALAEFTLSRKDPGYVGRAKKACAPNGRVLEAVNNARLLAGNDSSLSASHNRSESIPGNGADTDRNESITARSVEGGEPASVSSYIGWGSLICAHKPGDGSAREQAASCQRILGGAANIASEYATKRYRSNLINWGMLPFTLNAKPQFGVGDYIVLPGIRAAVENKEEKIKAYAVGGNDFNVTAFELTLGNLSDEERLIILRGGLINYYRNGD